MLLEGVGLQLPNVVILYWTTSNMYTLLQATLNPKPLILNPKP